MVVKMSAPMPDPSGRGFLMPVNSTRWASRVRLVWPVEVLGLAAPSDDVA